MIIERERRASIDGSRLKGFQKSARPRFFFQTLRALSLPIRNSVAQHFERSWEKGPMPLTFGTVTELLKYNQTARFQFGRGARNKINCQSITTRSRASPLKFSLFFSAPSEKPRPRNAERARSFYLTARRRLLVADYEFVNIVNERIDSNY